MRLSVVIPAHNEEENIRPCVEALQQYVGREKGIPLEIVVVDDNSRDGTAAVVREMMADDPSIRLVQRTPPAGFGRAIRAGLEAVTGDMVVIYMADLSDEPEDVVAYYEKIREGYDCVFGSRFMRGSRVEKYPWLKLVVNRIVNRAIQWMFWTKFNDLTNAFKAYRIEVIRACGPYTACHFNITIEMSLAALVRKFHIAQIPINWNGRTWGSSNLRMTEMGRRYLSTLMMLFFQKTLISDDLMAERLRSEERDRFGRSDLESRVKDLEQELTRLRELRESGAAVDGTSSVHDASSASDAGP